MRKPEPESPRLEGEPLTAADLAKLPVLKNNQAALSELAAKIGSSWDKLLAAMADIFVENSLPKASAFGTKFLTPMVTEAQKELQSMIQPILLGIDGNLTIKDAATVSQWIWRWPNLAGYQNFIIEEPPMELLERLLGPVPASGATYVSEERFLGHFLGPIEEDPKRQRGLALQTALLALHSLRGITFKLNLGSMVRQTCRPGEVLFRQGEYGCTAVYVLSGELSVYLDDPSLEKSDEGGSWWSSFKARFRGEPPAEKADEEIPEAISTDATLELVRQGTGSRFLGKAGPGTLLGEATCMNAFPRSASVRAEEKSEIVLMLRNVLSHFLKDKKFKTELEEKYRTTTLNNQLRRRPYFKGLSERDMQDLCAWAELLEYAPGQTIFEQGTAADALYIVNKGIVKIELDMAVKKPASPDQPAPKPETVVLNYLQRGQCFGELGLMKIKRTASCRAVNDVELAKIPSEMIRALTSKYPSVKTSLEKIANSYLDSQRHRPVKYSKPLDEFMDKGLVDAQDALVIDLDHCTRCDECVQACATAHNGMPRFVRDGVRYDNFLVTTSCRGCKDPLCLIGCPVTAIRREGASLQVVIKDYCIACGLCAEQCPYGNISIYPRNTLDPRFTSGQKMATVCDLGAGKETPPCVAACPHDAAKREDLPTFFASRLGIAPADPGDNA